jgi:plastocyanin
LDPEQVYAEVLQEEQQKGSSPPVAEGRAKAARVRAEHGSPHPKEPKWWPGAQPHLEGDAGAAPAEVEEAAAEVVEEPAAEAPVEQPAAEAPAEQPAAEAPAEQPAAQAPAEQPAAASAAQAGAGAGVAKEARPADQAERPDISPAPATQQPAAAAPAAAAPAAVAEAPPTPAATIGVRHGMPTGSRLRPEDAVATEAQFDGQRAMEQRRKLIDELVATGVPAVTAAQTGRERSPWLSLLYLVVPLLAVLFLVANYGGEEAAPATAPPENGGGGEGLTVVAESSQFDTDTIELQAQQEASINFVNRDTLEHNIAIYETPGDAESQSNAIFTGDRITASETRYTFDAPPAGEYVFQCDVHPSMSGDVIVSEAGGGEGGGEGGGGGGEGGGGGGEGGGQGS